MIRGGIDETIIFESVDTTTIYDIPADILHQLQKENRYINSFYQYVDKKTGEGYRIEDLQEKYSFGFMKKELWDIIERDYTTRVVHNIIS